MSGRNRIVGGFLIAVWVTALTSGCHTLPGDYSPATETYDLPRELEKISHPAYTVEPPDILLIEAYKGVPKPPHKIEALDVVNLQLTGGLPNEPLVGQFTVEIDGTLNLGPVYGGTGGTISVVNMTIPEAKVAIENFLKTTVKLADPKITLSLAQTRALQRVSGTHLVRPDGTVSLGSYGYVSVVGMTLPEVKRAIEAHLSKSLLDPEVSVEVQGFNSKLIYVIQDGGGLGQTVLQLPCTGNETVLDAIAKVNGLSAVSNTDKIWVARPTPCGQPAQILPVNWNAVVQAGETATNYQLLPGDRVFVNSQPLVRFDTRLSLIVAPIERVLGVTLLGNSAVRNLQRNTLTGGGGGF